MQIKNVPVTPRYWIAILVASMCGANTGDFLSHNLHLGHWRGLPPLAALFLIILWAERRRRSQRRRITGSRSLCCGQRLLISLT